MLIDTHAHIYSEEFLDDREAMLDRARLAGVGKIMMPNVDQHSIAGMLELELRYPDLCIPMMGLHPCYVKEQYSNELELVESWLKKRSFAAIGEIGMDLYWDTTFVAEQELAFRQQVYWASEYDLPIVIHCRNSIRLTLDILQSMPLPPRKGIFHCFSGTLEDAREVISMGFYLGIGGVVTFKNGGLDKVLPHLDLEHLVLETDCPYLAPVPFRGKRNEPSYLTHIVHRVSELMNIKHELIVDKTSENALKVFKL